MTGFLFSLPYILWFAFFLAWPLALAFYLIFHRWDLVTDPTPVGLRNLEFLLQDSELHGAIRNTLVFILIHIPLQIVVALGLAWALNQPIWLRPFFRAAYFLPFVISGAVITLLWSELLSTESGLLNRILQSLFGITVPWLTSPWMAMPSIAIMATWKNVGFYVILYLAGLQNIPKEIYEAADVEGASGWDTFRHITLPILRPVTGLVMTLSTIAGFQLFIEPFILTGGGPLGSSQSVVLYMYKHAFSFQHMGYAATLGFALALVIGAVVLVQKLISAERDRPLRLGAATSPGVGVAVSPAAGRTGDVSVPATTERRSPPPSPPSPWAGRTRRFLLHGLLMAGAIGFLYPFFWMVSLSLQDPSAGPATVIPAQVSLENYRTVAERIPIGRALVNSLLVSGCVTTSVLFFGALVGYALSKLVFPGSKLLLWLIFATLMIPGQLLLIPMYTLIVKFGWIDSYAGLIIPMLMNATSIVIFRQFFLEIPDALLEAARIDGCSEPGILFRIVWPLAKPTVITIGLLTFMASWNEVLWPLMVIRDRAMMTLPQMVTLFAVGGGAGGDMGVQMAAAMFLALPMLLIYLCLQRYFIEGIAASGIK